MHVFCVCFVVVYVCYVVWKLQKHVFYACFVVWRPKTHVFYECFVVWRSPGGPKVYLFPLPDEEMGSMDPAETSN